jgi:alkylation response protein AidB-like acyl-CoA dehydrogenase
MEVGSYSRFSGQFIKAIWRDLDPFEEEIEKTERLPYDRLMPLLRAMGAFGLMTPENYGGQGLTVTQYLPLLEELAKIQGGIRVVVHVHNTTAHALSDLGNAAQRQQLLPGCADGTKSISFALTEPDHGTGADLGTVAIRDGDDYLITGRKWLITNSDFASHFMVFAKTDPGAGAAGVSAILVERDTPGFTITALPENMGCKGGEHGLLTFEQVRVPVTNILGEEGMGLAQMEKALEVSRLFIAATSLGTAQRSLDLSIEHAKSRVTFGKPLAQRQAIQRYLAEMATDIYALRTMIAEAGAKWDRGLRIPAEASMCKLFGLEAVGRVTDRALLIHGGIGYTRAHPIERLYRDARLNWLEEGPPTIQHMVAAHELLNGFTWDR